MGFNIEKCESLHFGHANPRRTYMLGDDQIKNVDQAKDLGVLVDDQLKFHAHTARAVSKANRILGLIIITFNPVVAHIALTAHG